MNKIKTIGGSVEFGLDDFWYYYMHTLKNPLSEKEFKTIFRQFSLKLTKAIYEGDFIAFPYAIGDFYIKEYNPTIIELNGTFQHAGGKTTDYKATKDLWKQNPELAHKVYLNYENEHSGGKKYKLRRINSKRNNITALFNFTPSRRFDRGLAKYIKNSSPIKEYYYDK